MARTIKQLDVGTSVYIEEAGVPKEYVLLKKDDEGCILLRARALKRQRMNAENVAKYEGSEMDNWLTDDAAGYLSLFNEATKTAIIPRSRPTYEDGDEECHYIDRRAFLLTYSEVTNSDQSDLEPLKSLLPALMLWKGTADAYEARICYNEDGQAVYWWLSSPYSAAGFYGVYYYGGTSSNVSASFAYGWARPALNVSSDTIVSDEGADKIFLQPSESLKFLNIGKSFVRGLAEGITDERGAAVKAASDCGESASVMCNFCGHFTSPKNNFELNVSAIAGGAPVNTFKFFVCTGCESKVLSDIISMCSGYGEEADE